MNKFGNYLYALRRAKGMTQAELADLLGVTNKAVSKWETGESFPETSLLIPISDIFGVSVDDLLRGNARQETKINIETETDKERRDGKELDEASFINKTLAVEQISGKFRPESWSTKFAFLIGIGILLAAAGIIVGALSESESIKVYCYMATIILFVAAADLFTASGIVHERYFLPVENILWKKKVRRFAAFMVCGITIAGSAVCVFLCGTIFEEGQIYDSRDAFAFCVGAGIGLLAISAFFFVYGGITWDAFCKKALEKEYEKEQSDILRIMKRNSWEHDSFSGKFCSVVMILMTAIYVTLGLIWNLWDRAWIAFIIGALLCGIITVLFEKKKK